MLLSWPQNQCNGLNPGQRGYDSTKAIMLQEKCCPLISWQSITKKRRITLSPLKLFSINSAIVVITFGLGRYERTDTIAHCIED